MREGLEAYCLCQGANKLPAPCSTTSTGGTQQSANPKNSILKKGKPLPGNGFETDQGNLWESGSCRGDKGSGK